MFEHRRGRPLEQLNRRQSAGARQSAHAGSACRLHTRATVFDDHAPRRIGCHPLGRKQEEVGVGLAAGDILCTEDPPLKASAQAR